MSVRSSRLPDHWKAGTAPNASPTPIDTPNVNASTTPSRLASSSRTMSPGTSAGTARNTTTATATPSAPPPRLSTMLSVRSWRTSRPRPAPNAAQTANVRWRLTPRASSNPATLMQAISRTSAVAAVSAARAGRYSPTISSRSGITRTRFCESPEGRPPAPPAGSRPAAPSMRCRMARTSVAACPAETPSQSRPSTTTVALSG